MFKQFGGWFGDRIGLRYLLIDAAVEYDVALLRWPIARQIGFGRDGWLFSGSTTAKPAPRWRTFADGSVSGRTRSRPSPPT